MNHLWVFDHVEPEVCGMCETQNSPTIAVRLTVGCFTNSAFPLGFFPSTSTKWFILQTCSTGEEPDTAKTGCTTCSPGSYSIDGTDCVTCPTGKSKILHVFIKFKFLFHNRYCFKESTYMHVVQMRYIWSHVTRGRGNWCSFFQSLCHLYDRQTPRSLSTCLSLTFLRSLPSGNMCVCCLAVWMSVIFFPQSFKAVI